MTVISKKNNSQSNLRSWLLFSYQFLNSAFMPSLKTSVIELKASTTSVSPSVSTFSVDTEGVESFAILSSSFVMIILQEKAVRPEAAKIRPFR